jgi:hypothetical protein
MDQEPFFTGKIFFLTVLVICFNKSLRERALKFQLNLARFDPVF